MKRYISPITPEEREASYFLRLVKNFKILKAPCPISQAEIDEVKAERDRLRQLRGYGKRNEPQISPHSDHKEANRWLPKETRM